jgi:hypothetical protein
MDKFEAMRLFVKLIDEEKPDWWKTIPPPGFENGPGTPAVPPSSRYPKP